MCRGRFPVFFISVGLIDFRRIERVGLDSVGDESFLSSSTPCLDRVARIRSTARDCLRVSTSMGMAK